MMSASLGELQRFIEAHPFSGWLLFFTLLIFGWVNHIVKNQPFYSNIYARVIFPLAEFLKFNRLQRSAIKHDIQGRVNNVVQNVSRELPIPLKSLEIEWVKHANIQSFIEENRILVRVRPVVNQADNMINVTQPFLESILIPSSKLHLNPTQKNAIVAFTTKEVLGDNRELLRRFREKYFLPKIKKYPKLQDLFSNIEVIYRRGLFYSVAITALEDAVERNKYRNLNLEKDFYGILEQLVKFVSQLINRKQFTTSTPWEYKSPNLSYGLLLVAQPSRASKGDVDPYINRAQVHLDTQNLLFIAFSNQERNFGYKVAAAIEKLLPVNFIQELKSKYDYRNHRNGIIRVYEPLKNHQQTL